MMKAPELAELMKKENKDNAKLAVLDVNNEDTRKKDGVIPGAKLLTSADKFDTAKDLPTSKDSKLVFYCANTKCMASHMAAKRAAAAGYTDVYVMSDGIQGWAKSGQAVVPFTATTTH
jgi:rhodanese-related sulfurtransferase